MQTHKEEMMSATTIKTPYGTINRSGDREWFSGSQEAHRAALNWEYHSNPENADEDSLAREAALANERDEDEARELPLPEAE